MLRIALLGFMLHLSACASGLEPSLQTLVMSAQDDSTSTGQVGPEPPTWAQTARGDTSALSQVILLLPMKDKTKYLKRSIWPVQTGIPKVLGDSIGTNPFYKILPVDSAVVYLAPEERLGDISAERALAIGRFLAADWVMFGQIQGLTMSRFQATAPIGGHRNYKGLASVHLLLYNVVDGRREADVVVEREVGSKRTGIANPASHIHLDRQYYLLDQQVPWESEEFTTSLVGQALAMCASGVAEQLAEIVKPPPTLGVSGPKIIDIDGGTAYINIGIADGIRNGDKFGVWDRGRELLDPGTGQSLGHALPRRIGVVQVEQILSDHLALARILDGHATITKGYTIRPE
ncbi:MAG: hypothetical protein HOC05_08190 [Gemmatimonadetes bacterium]|nr:hypothetical protein [Gemmatimonadota bacterium]